MLEFSKNTLKYITMICVISVISKNKKIFKKYIK